MKPSNQKVEQVTMTGDIVLDYGEQLDKSELNQVISKYFQCEIKKGFGYGSYEGKQFCICYKNISYLGIPHPIFKKRIQIPSSFVKTYKENLSKGITTFFIGVYKYQENLEFVNFKTDNYVKNKAHNSSAHVLTIDLLYGLLKEINIKKDKSNNEICCFTDSSVQAFLNMYLVGSVDFTSTMFEVFNDFFDHVSHQWKGIDCYKEMIQSDYHRKYQGEWPGTYLEYQFEKYVHDFPNVAHVVQYAPSRGSEGIDLDLFFVEGKERGDLKAHSSSSAAIIGNKTTTIDECIANGKSVYYIVFNHDTKMDKDCNYEVTHYWNSAQGKSNLMSYHSRMKNSVKITDYMIIEINEKNIRYLNSDFQSGWRNSDNSSRSSKIMIGKRVLPNFVIHEYRGK